MSYSEGYNAGVTLSPYAVKERVNIRHPRRFHHPPYYNNQALLTAFATACLVAFMIIYLEVSRLLIPDNVITLRELRHQTRGFANDMPSRDKHRRHLPLHFTLRRQKPSAIVIGFSHCGANYILDELALHPDVVINRKNLHFFEGNGTEKWYVSNMPLTLPHHVTLDVSLNYVTNATTLRQIATFDKNIRIIIVICNPLIRLLFHRVVDSLQEVPLPFLRNVLSSKGHDSPEREFQGILNESVQNIDIMKSKSVIFNGAQQSNRTHKVTETQHSMIHALKTRDHEADIAKIISNLRLEVMKQHNINIVEEKDKLNSVLLHKNGDFYTHLARVFTLFPEKQVRVVELGRFLSHRTKESSRLFKFLHVNLPSKHFFNKVPIENMNPSEEQALKAHAVLDILKTQERQLFQQVDNLYSSLNSKLFSFLNESFGW